jgi:hypothetical protein
MDEKTEKPKSETVPFEDASDLSDLWFDPALGDGLTDTILRNIPIGKPKDFFRVHPDKHWRRITAIYVHKPEGQIEAQHFFVTKAMQAHIPEVRLATVVTCIYRDGSVRLWPLKRPNSGEKDNEAWVSARNAAREAMTKWVRLVWVRRAYEWREAQPGFAPEPEWGKLPSFDQLMHLALGPNGIIRDTNHPIYRDLMGTAPKPSLKVVGGDDADSDDDDDL